VDTKEKIKVISEKLKSRMSSKLDEIFESRKKKREQEKKAESIAA